MSQQKPSSKKRESSREPWPFSAAASLVSRLAAPASEKVTQMRDGYGMKCSASFAKLDPAGLWRKTCGGFSQPRLFQTEGNSLEEYSETWPKAGIVLDGYAMELVMSGPHTKGKGFLSWRTPQAHNAMQGPKSKEFYEECRKTGKSMVTLTDQVKHETWPTPTAITDSGGAAMCKWGGSGARKELIKTTPPEEMNGQLNPDWVTLLMGFPPGWLDIDGLPAQAPSTPGNRRE